MADPIQKKIAENRGVEYLAKLLQPARMDHGEAMMVTFATKVLDNLMGEGIYIGLYNGCVFNNSDQ